MPRGFREVMTYSSQLPFKLFEGKWEFDQWFILVGSVG